MKKLKANYSLKSIAATIILIVVSSVAFYFYWDITKIIIRRFLEEKFIGFFLLVITVLIFIFHYVRLKSKEVESEPIITKKYGAFIDNILGGIVYGTTITTSLTLLKGLFIQKFFSDKTYFLEFKELDLMTIFGVVLFLLYFSFMKIIEIAKEAYKIEHTEQVLNEHREIVTKK